MENKTIKFHPILFSTSMVQAILEGKKKQTRRVIKSTPIENENYHFEKLEKFGSKAYGMIPNKEFEIDNINSFSYNGIWFCPYEVDDVLWVRENFYTGCNFDHLKPSQLEQCNVEVFFQADLENYDIPSPLSRGKIRPSIFLPFKYCRTFLKIKSIRVERLQDISEEDAQAEGAHFLYHGLGTVIIDSHPDWEKLYKPRASYKDGFHYIWKYINGEESWQLNPYVFVYEFEKIEKPLDFIV